MMYILTEAEYQALKAEQEGKALASTKKLQDLCTRIANTMPVVWKGWRKDHPIEPWGCMLTAQAGGEEWYCDNCPVTEICPSGKSWSK